MTLVLLRAVDESAAIKAMPWGVIMMVTGVTVLIAMLEKTEGLDADYARDRQRLDAAYGRRRSWRSAPGWYRSTAARRASCCRRSCRWRPNWPSTRRDGSAADRLGDERVGQPRGPVVALDGRRAVYRRGAAGERHAPAVQSAAGLGPRMTMVGAATLLAAVRLRGCNVASRFSTIFMTCTGTPAASGDYARGRTCRSSRGRSAIRRRLPDSTRSSPTASGRASRASCSQQLPDLRIIAQTGNHANHIDFAAARELGIVVARASGGYSVGAAELAIGLAIAVMRQIPAARRGRAARRLWTRPRRRVLQSKVFGHHRPRAGRAATWRDSATAFGMRVVAWGPRLTDADGRCGRRRAPVARRTADGNPTSCRFTRRSPEPREACSMRAGCG